MKIVVPAGRFPRAPKSARKLALHGFMAFALVSLTASPAQAEHPQGVWGTAPACEAWRAGDEPRPELQLYEIGEQWLRRHVFYCMIQPQQSFRAPDGRWLLEVVCGEDARQVGRYLTLDIRDAGALTVTWGTATDPETFTFGPFERCDVPDTTG